MATRYVPSDMKTAGNFKIVFADSIADLAEPTVAELDAGISVECATRNFDQSTNVQTESDQYLCDTEARESIGQRTRQMSPFEFDVTDPQAADDLTDMLTEDAIVYMWVRPGIAHDTAIAASQRGWGYRVEVASIDPLPISAGTQSGGGSKFGFRVSLNVKDRELSSVVTGA